MFRVRVLLLWLVMLAVPFQGYAAASMGVCTARMPAPAAAAVGGHAQPHEHAMHDHASATQTHHPAHAKSAKAQPDLGASQCASCSLCAACHAAALTGVLAVALLAPVPQADPAEPADAMATLAPRVPDKPPRA
ncbi:hypothetical protein [Variovorax sp. PBL-E5]|uniref:hypothetical protein n=1 Tax=Variovorax sp. PBL-E5 TaxID=434014 RepID=UPI0013162A0C|nr:hypothetical protein [Variovorax sp. PBL-E5]VTU32959.1 hypothetical protein E5CHR_03521 [Variovorax sp. PBL-E5]